ncbi:ASPRV1 [Cordylochernes scorpioides]|uniref:ASPRV1 n=1 Tax=Cordylochernes scorpioides TaxID=51811 RepID=A0ABY6KTE1_9ARAC|nr:ASPRV1 [Cordylochernes scorpioides]
MLRLQKFIEIKYKPGKELVIADCLSRAFLQEEEEIDQRLDYPLAAQAVRRSRRLQGVEHQENIAMVEQETQTQKGEYYFQPFRNPSIFTGEHNQNPEKWLKEYHRVARYNCWDDSMCLANVYFFLQGTAYRWYENVEENITS